MRRLISVALSLLVTTALFRVTTDEAWARGRSSSSRSSFSRSRPSSSRSSSSRSSTYSSRSRATSSSSRSRSVARTSQPKRSAADKQLADKAKAAGTSYKSRDVAAKAFREKYSKDYTSKYNTQPSNRPDHIPERTTVGGRSVVVVYDSSHRGYGYYGVGGGWCYYDPWDDPYTMRRLMRRHNYYYDDYHRYSHYDGRPRGRSWFGFFVGLLIVGIFIAVAVAIVGASVWQARVLNEDGRARSGKAGRRKKAAPPPTSDKNDPAFWRQVTPGSRVTLSDEQALEDAMKAGGGIRGLEYGVRCVDLVTDLDELAEWRFYCLDRGEEELLLMAKIVDDAVDLVVYFEHPDVKPGTRAELLDEEAGWMFEEPDAHEGVRPSALAYVREVCETIADDEEESEIHYCLKGQGVMHGRVTRSPYASGTDTAFVSVAEYRAAGDCENPELLILERGGEDNPDGGHVTVYLGSNVNLSEIDVLSAGDSPT